MDEFLSPSSARKLRCIEGDNGIVRIKREAAKNATRIDDSITKTKTPIINDHMSKLTSDDLLPSTSSSASKKRSQKQAKQDIPMEKRLKQMTVQHSERDQGSLSVDSMAVLLVQGLHSQDVQILDQVLTQSDEDLVTLTIKQLPLLSVIPLINEITRRLEAKTKIACYVKWLKITVSTHISFLSTHPDVVESLSTVYRMMDSRLSLLEKVVRLQGRLNLLKEQTVLRVQPNHFSSQEAKLSFQEESDDDVAATPGSDEDVTEDWGDLEMSDSDEKDDLNEGSYSEQSDEDANGPEGSDDYGTDGEEQDDVLSKIPSRRGKRLSDHEESSNSDEDMDMG